MKIAQKFKYLYPEGFIHDSLIFLTKARGEVDWGGQHVLTMQGCEDKMAFGEFIKACVAPNLDSDALSIDVAIRVDALRLIDRIRQLMEESVLAKQNTWLVRFIPASLESEMAQLGQLELRVRAFTKTSFERLFPGHAPETKTSIIVKHAQHERYVVSKKELVALYSPV